MKNTLIILSIALLPTLVQAEKAPEKQADTITVSEVEAAKKDQASQDVSLATDASKENSASKAEADSSTQAK
jgi:hypothetical protein